MNGKDTKLTPGFAVVTAPGRSAIATVIVHGTDAITVVNKLFQPVRKSKLSPEQIGKVIYGHWLVDGEPSEDLIVSPKAKDCCEIHCHGGETASSMIARSLEQHGVVKLSPFELASRMHDDPLQADLELTLSKAKTPRIVRMLLNQIQLQPEFWQQLRTYADQGNNEAIEQMASDFRKWEGLGLRLTSEWQVTLCGAPNVGKSSLINAMLGFERAIVHSEAGTTRDALDELTAIDGWPIRIYDTAGVRSSQDDIEMQGVSLTHQVVEKSDLVMLVLDASQADPLAILNRLNVQPDLILANKSDLHHIEDSNVDLHLSAKTGEGIPELLKKITRTLIPELPEPQTPIPVSTFQLEHLNTLIESLAQKKA